MTGAYFIVFTAARDAGECAAQIQADGVLSKPFVLADLYRCVGHYAQEQKDQSFPSSKRCHECGHCHDGLTLADRVWTCPGCGCVLACGAQHPG